ncbi:MFS transporter [Streptantibioticus silvisoli]|uniref:MFS transporter n=1 Tax=Streptantibioticus silvisoli TaxID=2705255 RepID=A0ABT6W210_9ACTN|nr:MFS transporter [Streptantibioticus silvisoli]MDI5964324.1 MFS transporter [Streptantibioticus silvisoli]
MTTTPAPPVDAPVTPPGPGDPGGRLRWATLAVCGLASMLLGIDNSVLNYAIPSLVRDLDPSATQVLWIADIYGFAMGGLLLVMGNVGDRYGRKRLMMAGAVLFGAASLVTAYADSAATLIAARAVLGVAGAMILPSTLSLVRHAFTVPKERTLAIGISGGVAAASFALGPVVGGFLLDRFWWGSVFLVNVPIMAVVLVSGLVVLRESRSPLPGRLDRISVPLSVAAMLGLIYAVKTLARSGVHDTSAWLAAGVGLLCGTVFLRRQTRLAEPLLDVRLFRNPAFSGAISSNVIGIFASTTLSLAFSLYLQVVRGWSPLLSGLALLPGPLSAAVAAPAAAVLIPRLGRARVVSLGLALMTVSSVALATLGVGTPYWPVILPGLVVNGTGIVLLFSVTSDTVLASVPRGRTGTAAGISESAQEVGGALGIAVLGSVLNAFYRGALTLPAGLPAGAARTARDSVTGGVQVGSRLPGRAGALLVNGAKHAFTHSMHVTLLTTAVLLAAGAVAALFTLRGVPAEIPDPDATTDTAPAPAGAATPLPHPARG